MLAQLVAGLVVVSFDDRVLEGAVHPFDLAVRPGMIGLCQSMFDSVLTATQTEHM
jgi:hypothetical protein